MAAVATPTQDQSLYTCLSCSIAFTSPDDQRVHYRSDHHRYNMKRRVASLPPVSVTVFNQKVLDKRQETAIQSSTKGSFCDICSKTYTTENAYRSHINSKKHKENEIKVAVKARSPPVAQPDVEGHSPSVVAAEVPVTESAGPSTQARLIVDADATEDDVADTIDAKIAAARSRLSSSACLFCPTTSASLADNLTHMSTVHSFFIPDAEYLVDLEGLITYLGEKIAVGNVCVYCNAKSRDFRTIEAVRKHMVDKSHCKIAYDSESDRLEISDFYDFSSSYPDYEARMKRRQKRAAKPVSSTDEKLDEEDEEQGEWEDMKEDDGSEADEIIEESASDETSPSDDESIPEDEITFGDSPYELVLPSGARIGHRAMRRYYSQAPPRTLTALRNGQPEDENSGAALVRRLLADKNSALVPRRGGFGAFGSGTDVVKARNRGEAKEAGRHTREFRDMRRRQEFMTKVGYRNNHQKHFRDPLLQ
ncbi:hypothetical protein BD410DRAFT_745544 [Rickenella mellea]|uniref:C2H2-type domain-containing protein n=1 Tax=Rickenella mellea TaxID=50990 RepID=A0A4Y7Q9F0_9AGAM|nr:hypothetical protein BD410DRAFT_745544 [Rickenella mellea]